MAPLLVLVLCLVACAKGLKIGFVGDTGAQTSGNAGFYAQSVFQMLRDQNVDIVLQNGDFDYNGSPSLWKSFLDAQLGDMEILTTSGNHETDIDGQRWYGSSGYKVHLTDRLKASSLFSKCSDSENYGERYHCTIDGSLFVMLGWRETRKSKIDSSTAYLEQVLASSDAPLKWCIWHQPEGKMNSGDAHDTIYGLEPLYEMCRKYGAVVTNGHSHVYARTKLVSSFYGDPTVSPLDDALDVKVSCGETVSFVVGMGGFKADSNGQYAQASWFRKTFSKSNFNTMRAGALVCDTDYSTAACEFIITQNNEVYDSFTLHRDCVDSPEAPCLLENIDYYGNDLADKMVPGVSTGEACQVICQEEPKCEFFSWVSRSHTWIAGRGNCYLKSSNTGMQVNKGTFSGPKVCSTLAPTVLPTAQPTLKPTTAITLKPTAKPVTSYPTPEIPVDCLEDGIDLYGGDLVGVNLPIIKNVQSAQECQLHCQMEPKCTQFSWLKASNSWMEGRLYCFLKGSSGTKRTANPGVVSGPSDCKITTCFEEKMDYFGSDLTKIKDVTSPAMCQALCRDYPGCKYFSWLDADHSWVNGRLSCFLKDRSTPNRKGNQHVVSGPSTCSGKDVAAGIRSMTHNIKGWDATINFAVLSKQITDYAPDVLGVQELFGQTAKLEQAIGMVSVGAAHGDGDDNVFYNPVTTDLMDSGFLLPIQKVQGDKWGPRAVIWAKFKRKADNFEYNFYTSHWAVGSETYLEKTAESVSSYIIDTAGGHAVILSGDFNVFAGQSNSLAIRYLTRTSPLALTDAHKSNQGTFGDAKIDFILYSKQLSITSQGILDYAGSDHKALFAEFQYSIN